MFFWSHPRCFGPLGKFQHNIKISIKMACVSRLSVSYDYGKTIRAFIVIVYCSDLNAQLFTILAIFSIKRLTVDPKGNKNSDFLQWTIVLYALSNLLFDTFLSAFQIFSSSAVTFVMGKTFEDIASITFGSIVGFCLQTFVC